MAINKVVNKSTKSHGAMKNVIGYVLRDDKIKEGYVDITGLYSSETINTNDIYQAWLEEKRIWNKDSGRMYAHNIISFHKGEQVGPEQVFEIGKKFSEKFFPDHQSLIGVHQDKDHLHCHIVTNSVSYIDGHKLHQTKKDLEQQKIFTNKLCLERGLSVAKKGKHFDGSIMEQGEIIAWNKDKYNLLINDSRKSFVADCAIAIMESLPLSCNKDDFISSMQERGWSVQWTDRRKHIVFQNENGDKVRDSNIEKTFSGMEVNKEALTNEFTRQNELRLTRLNAEKERAEAELRQYYSELESAAAGIHTAEAIRDNKKAGRGDPAVDRYDTDSFIRELDSKEKASGKDRDDHIAERQDREAEQRRLSLAGKRALKAEQQRAAEERTRRKSRSFRHSFSR